MDLSTSLLLFTTKQLTRTRDCLDRYLLLFLNNNNKDSYIYKQYLKHSNIILYSYNIITTIIINFNNNYVLWNKDKMAAAIKLCLGKQRHKGFHHSRGASYTQLD